MKFSETFPYKGSERNGMALIIPFLLVNILKTAFHHEDQDLMTKKDKEKRDSIREEEEETFIVNDGLVVP